MLGRIFTRLLKTTRIHTSLLNSILEVQATHMDVLYPCSMKQQAPEFYYLSDFRKKFSPSFCIFQNFRQSCQLSKLSLIVINYGVAAVSGFQFLQLSKYLHWGNIPLPPSGKNLCPVTSSSSYLKSICNPTIFFLNVLFHHDKLQASLIQPGWSGSHCTISNIFY